MAGIYIDRAKHAFASEHSKRSSAMADNAKLPLPTTMPKLQAGQTQE